MKELELPTGNSKASLGVELKTLAEVEKVHILNTLTIMDGNKTKTADALGVSLKTLYNKLHSYGVMEKKDESQRG